MTFFWGKSNILVKKKKKKKNEALSWSTLVKSQKHNVQKPNGEYYNITSNWNSIGVFSSQNHNNSQNFLTLPLPLDPYLR